MIQTLKVTMTDNSMGKKEYQNGKTITKSKIDMLSYSSVQINSIIKLKADKASTTKILINVIYQKDMFLPYLHSWKRI